MVESMQRFEGGCANHRYAHRIWACDAKFFTEQGAPSHVVEGIQRAVRAGARTIDSGVANAGCISKVSQGERVNRDGGRTNQSLPMKHFGPVLLNFSQGMGATACGRKYTAGREVACPSHVGVGNSVFDETISKITAAPRIAEILFQIRGARNGGRQSESYRHSDVGL